jgi:hypothetical protein
MRAAFWMLSIGLALAFAITGAMKLALPRHQLVLHGAEWTQDFASGMVRFVGVTELVAAIGMTVPAVLPIPQLFAWTAEAASLIVISLGAALVHARRREVALITWNSLLLAVAAISVWERCRR